MWSSIFNRWKKLTKNQRLSILAQLHDEKNCILGEAHGFTGNYSRFAPDTPQRKICIDCDYMAAHFLWCICGQDLTLDEELLTMKANQLVSHWTAGLILKKLN